MEIFENGDLVDWSNIPLSKEMKTKYGNGPFHIIKTFGVPKDKVTDVGHGQWVVIRKDIDGQPYIYDFLGKECWIPMKSEYVETVGRDTFSASYFTKK